MSAAVPIVVHTGPIVVHTAPIVHTSDTATTVIAAFGLLFALASLGWQAWTFRLSGSRVRVDIARGLKSGTHALTMPSTATPQQIERMSSQGFTQPVLAVTVSNSGRGETSIASVDVLLPGGGGVDESVHEPPLPFRLAGESEQTWYFDALLAEGYVRVFDEHLPKDKPRTARGRVRLGGRKEAILSRNEVVIGLPDAANSPE
ncbi:MAG: hypothetical protein WB698_04795 [Solirubrobacteraceae bacterium]